MVAVGNLAGIWTEVPEEPPSMEVLKELFFARFGKAWEEVMVGASRPFAYHRDWRSYLAVSHLVRYGESLLLADLTAKCQRQGVRVIHILTG